MRYLLACLCLATLGCGGIPRAPLTDVAATNTERTGLYEVVERTAEGKRYALRVVAMHPDRAHTIADNLVVQLLPESPEEILVEVAPHESVQGETRRIRWVRGSDVPASTVPSSHDAASPADRIGNRPTGQSGTARDE
jgi:hypothetical protein